MYRACNGTMCAAAPAPSHATAYAAAAEFIRGHAASSFPHLKLTLTSPTFLSLMTAVAPKTTHDEYFHPHVDTKQYPGFCVTGLVYLSDHGADFSGGEFEFLGKHPAVVTPKMGDLLLFTSGEENLHRVRRVTGGTERRALTIAFSCGDPKGKPLDLLANYNKALRSKEKASG